MMSELTSGAVSKLSYHVMRHIYCIRILFFMSAQALFTKELRRATEKVRSVANRLQIRSRRAKAKRCMIFIGLSLKSPNTSSIGV